jgi:hypothetical protein
MLFSYSEPRFKVYQLEDSYCLCHCSKNNIVFLSFIIFLHSKKFWFQQRWRCEFRKPCYSICSLQGHVHNNMTTHSSLLHASQRELIFHCLNPLHHIMALGSTQPMQWADNLTTFMCRVLKCGRCNFPEPFRPVQVSTGIALFLCWYISNNCKYKAKLDQIFKHQKHDNGNDVLWTAMHFPHSMTKV